MINAPPEDALTLAARARGGNPAAQAILSGLFKTTPECFLCSRQIYASEDYGLFIFPGPDAPQRWTIAWPECRACTRLSDRHERERTMLRTIWPLLNWLGHYYLRST